MDHLKHPVILIISFFVILFVYTKFGPQLPISVTTHNTDKPFIVEGTGTAVGSPDTLKVNIGIEESSQTLSMAQNQVNSKSKAIVKILKKLGIEDKDIKTVSYNIYPNYNYETGNPKITGYRINSVYEVRIKDFDEINEIIAQSTQVGANNVGNISFDFSKETKDKLTEEARKEAVEEAKKKAESLAKVSGITLGKIINISEFETPNFYPMPLALKESGGVGGEVARPEIKPGQSEFKVNVGLTYEIR